jgi:alkane 1-monooxygenase
MSVLSYCLIFLVPLSVVPGYLLGGMYTFLTPFFVFGVIPALDVVIGISKDNPTPSQELDLKEKTAYRMITIMCVPLQVTMVCWGAWIVSHRTLSPFELAGFVCSMGVSSGVMGINVSHELQHRVNGKLEPFLSRIMLLTVLYMHWAIEHVAGHHRNVATYEDPATAHLGESFYAFWFRTVFGGMVSAWKIEKARLHKKEVPVVSVRNRMILYIVSEVIFTGMILALFGFTAVAYLILQGVIAFSLLEVVNYIEHYGLLRNRKSDGGYEPVSFLHSWNSSNWLSNRFLFNLQRHSDHHYKPDRRYQVLRHYDESPQLPTGYAGMILLAVVPPLWGLVMDHRVQKLRLTEKES